MMERSLAEGEVLFFSTDEVLVRTLSALCGLSGHSHADTRPRLCIADGEESSRTRCMEVARSHRAAVLLLGGDPIKNTTLPLYHLPRPFLFSDFMDILRQVSAPTPSPAPKASRVSKTPVLVLEAAEWMCWGENRCHLTPAEARVLQILMAYAPNPVSRDALARVFAGNQGNGVEVYISYLRRKLRQITANVGIVSVRGQGYALLGGETLQK